MRDRYDIVIVGGGMAGVSLAWALAERGVSDVLLLEREEQHGVHATGRSAATLVEHDGTTTLAALKVGGGAFLRDPPAGFSETPLLTGGGVLFVYDTPEPPALPLPGVRCAILGAEEIRARVPAIQAARCGVFLPEGGHIDVHGLLSAYLAAARRAGVTVLRDAAVTGLARGVVTLDDGRRCAARCIVNAAGAWASPIAELAGAAPIAIRPLRRSIATFAAASDVTDWPFTIDEGRSIYFGPESGGLLLSPMDETPSPPCDARADDEAIAAAFERLDDLAPGLAPQSLRRRWAGLRSFSPDRVPVVGPDPLVPGFFWLAGQGGCGIETSPFLARIAADILLDGRTQRFDASLLAPARFSARV